MDNKLKVALGFFVGAAAGAAIGLLTAPASGKETRKLITDKASDLGDDIKSRAEDGLNKAKDTYNSSLDKAKVAYNESVSKAVKNSKKTLDNISSKVSAN